jgi:glutamyl-tRNA reductase
LPRSTPEHFIVLTLNHQTLSLKDLSRFSFTHQEMDAFLDTLKRAEPISEIAGVCTCNRMEFYAAVHSIKDAAHVIVHHLAEKIGIKLEDLSKGLDVIVDAEGVEHLFRLACSLESMVLGDAQIFGQIKRAYNQAKKKGIAKKVFNILFPAAFSTAKRVHSETGLGEGRLSVSALAVECAIEYFESLDAVVATVIGAGKMGRLAAKYLTDAGVKELRIVNRDVDKSLKLAAEVGGKAYNFDELEDTLVDSHLVISSTASEEPIIHPSLVSHLGAKNNISRLFIDIAMPADIDPAITEIEGATLVDLESLRETAKKNEALRAEKIALADEIIAEELEKIGPWPLPFHIDKFASQLGDLADQICQVEIEHLFSALPNLTPEQKTLIKSRMERLAERMILAPRRNIRTHRAARTCPNASTCLAELYALDCGSRTGVAKEECVIK